MGPSTGLSPRSYSAMAVCTTQMGSAYRSETYTRRAAERCATAGESATARRVTSSASVMNSGSATPKDRMR